MDPVLKAAFPRLTDADLERLAALAERAFLRAGEVVLAEGELNRTLFLVREGRLRVEKDADGRRVEVAQLAPGELFGDVSFVAGGAVTASVVVDQAAALDRIDGASLDALLAADAALAARFYHSVAQGLAERLRDRTEAFAVGIF
ncbi:MAG: cyclic nucleotide-binding domain-containing protein [bacterium]